MLEDAPPTALTQQFLTWEQNKWSFLNGGFHWKDLSNLSSLDIFRILGEWPFSGCFHTQGLAEIPPEISRPLWKTPSPKEPPPPSNADLLSQFCLSTGLDWRFQLTKDNYPWSNQKCSRCNLAFLSDQGSEGKSADLAVPGDKNAALWGKSVFENPFPTWEERSAWRARSRLHAKSPLSFKSLSTGPGQFEHSWSFEIQKVPPKVPPQLCS